MLIIYPNNSTGIWCRKKGFADALHIFLPCIGLFYMICECSIKLFLSIEQTWWTHSSFLFFCRFLVGLFQRILQPRVSERLRLKCSLHPWNSNPPLKPVRPRCYYPLLCGTNHHTEGGQERVQIQSKCGWPAKWLIKLLVNLWLPGLMKVWSKKRALNGQPACSQCVAIIPKQAESAPAASSLSKFHTPGGKF